MHLEVEETGLGAEHGCGLWFGDQGEAVIVLVTQETSLDGSCSCRGLASIVPDSGYGEEVSDVALFSVENLSQALLQLIAHCLSQLEEVVGGDVDFRLSGRKGRKVDRIDVGVSGKHELQFEPLDFLDTRLGVASGRQSVRNVRTPADDLLVLIVVEDRGNL